jgi:hypothetical protein
VTAATQQVGVMRLDSSLANPVWFPPTVDSGLPPRDLEGNLMPVRSVAIDPGATMIMAGGPVGVRRTTDAGDSPTTTPHRESEPKYESCSESEFSEEVTLPPTWLFVCGENELTVTADATT